MTDHCDHKFIDSNHCLKCGWTPPRARRNHEMEPFWLADYERMKVRAETAEAQLTALQAEQAQWQQIETAPMTTERVVYVLISDGVCLPDIAVWKPERPERTSGGTRSLAIPAGWFGADGVRSRVTPTFWRPLPQLAALTAQQEKSQP